MGIFTRKTRNQSATAQPAALPRREGKPRTGSLFGAEVAICGDIETTGDVQIDGRLLGNIRCRQFVQGAGSDVKGDIVAETARIAGSVEGTVSARHLAVAATARIEGKVEYGDISVQNGGRIDGRLSKDGCEHPAERI